MLLPADTRLGSYDVVRLLGARGSHMLLGGLT